MSRKRLLPLFLSIIGIMVMVLPAWAATPDASRLVAPQVISTTPPAYDKVRYEASLMLKDYLEKLGLEVSVKVQDLKILMQKIRVEPFDFDLYVKGWGSTTDRIDPHNFLFSMLSCTQAKNQGLNRQGYCDPEYQKLIEAAEATMDPAERRKKLFKAQEYIADQVAIFPFVFDNELQPYNKGRIKNLTPQGGIGIFNYNAMINAKITKGEPVLRIAQRQGNDLLNPMSMVIFTDRQVIDLIYDYLARLDVNNEAKPCIAESWKVLDDTTIEVKVRSGLTFHDGHALTAEDVKFTFDYGKKWGFGRLDSYLKPIEKVELVDDNTLRFQLKEPTGYLITSTFVSVPILPRHIWENITETEKLASPHDWPCNNPVGSGPFKFNYWRRGRGIAFGYLQGVSYTGAYRRYYPETLCQPRCHIGRFGGR